MIINIRVKILLILLASIQFSTNAQSIHFGNKAKIFLVRHAEKGTGDDPLLTDRGNKRAGELMSVLKNKKIGRIYVTEFRRTQNTSDSLRIQMGIDTVHYLADPSLIGKLFNKIKVNNDLNKPILVIGHSNTIPVLIRKLGVAGFPNANIPENEFDNLFLITYKNGKTSLKKMKYGGP